MSWKPGQDIFDLDVLKAELALADPQESMHDDEVQEKWVYLGTVFSLMPSGKFYMPWACSNLEACEACGGAGHVQNEPRETLPGPAADALLGMAKKIDWKVRELAMRHYGMACEGQWPVELGLLLTSTQDLCEKLKPQQTCSRCGGCGSEEAHLDEMWREQAEEELGQIDAFLTGGEGDPCDLYAVVVVESDEG